CPALVEVFLHPFPLLCAGAGGELADDALDVDPAVPDVQVPQSGELAHRRAIRPGHSGADLRAGLGVEAAGAAGNREAGDQTFDLPLEWSWKGLVEGVDCEDEPPVRRREDAEVRQVGISAELRMDARPWT